MQKIIALLLSSTMLGACLVPASSPSQPQYASSPSAPPPQSPPAQAQPQPNYPPPANYPPPQPVYPQPQPVYPQPQPVYPQPQPVYPQPQPVYPQPQPVPAPYVPAWDRTGWVVATRVQFPQPRREDSIVLNGSNRGPYSRLMLEVDDGDLTINDLVVHFANGEQFSPKVKARFYANSRSRAIDLPGAARQISRIDIRYGNIVGRNAALQIWGLPNNTPSSGNPTPPTPTPNVPAWDNTGWVMAVQTHFNQPRRRDSLTPARNKRGPYTRLMLEVTDGDLTINDLVVHFANGEHFSPKVKVQFDANSRSRAIDLPGSARQIAKIDVTYGNIMAKKADLRIWGLPGTAGGSAQPNQPTSPAPYPTTPANPNPAGQDLRANGWTKIGEQMVDGSRDRDLFNLPANSRFTQLTLVVLNSDLVLRDVEVTFGNGELWSPKVRQVFQEGSRSRIIDLPGKKRVIKSISLVYENTAGGGRAAIQVWGK